MTANGAFDGYNIFAYCLNNPVDNVDSSGTLVVRSVTEIINGFAGVAGFVWDSSQKIWYAKQNCWQRDWGYCKLYDIVAPSLGIRIQSKPIEINYGGKIWCIWMWKGVYGITIGAEIGIYIYSNTYGITYHGITASDRWFRSAYDTERMQISLTLYKNSKKVFSRNTFAWWQTGFKIGVKMPWDKLKMKASITFPDMGLARLFARKMGVACSSTTVSFTW